MGVPTFHAIGSFASAGGTSASPPLPVRSTNDILIAHIILTTGGKTFAVSGGWAIGNQISTGNVSAAWAWRVVDGAEAACPFTWSGSATGVMSCSSWTGAGSTTAPFGATNKATANASTTATAASLISTANNSLEIAYIGVSNNNSPPLPTSFATATNASNGNGGYRLCYGTIFVSGSIGDSISDTIVSANWATFAIELLGSGSPSGEPQNRYTGVCLQVLRSTNVQSGHTRFNMPMLGR
jgi:hypothetical protein